MSSPPLGLLLVLIGLPFLAAVLLVVVDEWIGDFAWLVATTVSTVCLAIVARLHGMHGRVGIQWIDASVLGTSIELSFLVDGLSVLIGVLASGIGIAIFLYSWRYMADESGTVRYYATLLAFLGSMLGVAFAADLISLFVFWELTSLTSFFLIGHHWQARSSTVAARKALIVTVAGGLFLLVGLLLLHWASQPVIDGTFAIPVLIEHAPAIRAQLQSAGLFWPLLACIAIGVAAKSAQVPLHFWLPDAMQAPTPVSAFLHSATMVKAGVYLVGRFRPLLLEGSLDGPWTLVFASLGLTTMVVTALLAFAATDLKELLAYSTASHLGLIIAGFGFASTVGAATGSFHILNHAIFKATLFLITGIVAHEAGTRMIPELGGLRKELPVTAGIAIIAGLSMAGVPPLKGLYSKELLFKTTWTVATEAGGLAWALPVIAVAGSIVTVLYSIRFLRIFIGEQPPGLEVAHRPHWGLLVPPAILAVLAVLVGLVPQLVYDEFIHAVQSAAVGTHDSKHLHVGLPTHMSGPVVMSIITLGIGLTAASKGPALHIGLRRVGYRFRNVGVNRFYHRSLDTLELLATRVRPAMGGPYLRTAVYWVLLATVSIVLGGYVFAGVSVPATVTPPETVAMVLVLGTSVLAGIAIIKSGSHVGGVLALSILGFMVAIAYTLANAPDLALTQLVVETLVLVLFLLIIDQLPPFYVDPRRWRLLQDGALSALVGITVAVTAYLSTSATPQHGISSFFIERAPLGHPAPSGLVTEVGGGSNIVNVILVDFRAFDTMGEISVVAMAGLAVVTLLLTRREGQQP